MQVIGPQVSLRRACGLFFIDLAQYEEVCPLYFEKNLWIFHLEPEKTIPAGGGMVERR